MLDQVGLGRPRTARERLLSAALGIAGTGSWLLPGIRGPRPGFLLTFAWLAVTSAVLTVLDLHARRRRVSRRPKPGV